MTRSKLPATLEPPLLREILTSRTVRAAGGEELPLHSHLPPDECLLLQAWMREWQPRRVLEIGLAYGVSTLAAVGALSAVDGLEYHVIDAFQLRDWLNIGVLNLERAGFSDRVVFHEALSELCLPVLLDAGHRFDAAIIDGWHTFDHVLLDFFYVNRMLSVAGHVVFDDGHLPQVQKAISYICSFPAYERVEPPATLPRTAVTKARGIIGLPPYRLVAVKKTAEDERPFDWHADV